MARRLLVVTRHTPLPWEDGAGAYLFDLLRFLHRKGFEIHVAWLAPHDHLRWQGIWTISEDFARVVTLHVPGGIRFGRSQLFPAIYWLPLKARVLDKVKTFMQGLGLNPSRTHANITVQGRSNASAPEPWMAIPSTQEAVFVEAVIRRLRPDAIIANYPWMTPLFDLSPAQGPRRICLHYDVAWKRANLQAELTGLSPEISRDEEARLLSRAETIVCISEADRHEVRAMSPASEVLLAPKAVEPRPLPPSESKRLLFVGSGNAFNIEGVLWFLRTVWPLVCEQEPDAELDICGSVSESIVDRPGRVTFCGSVADLTPYYANAAVVVVPLRRATGLNIKLVDAASHGRAIVAATATLNGAPFLADAVLTANDPERFSAAVVRLLRNPAIRIVIGERALAAVRLHLDPQACYGPLATWLRLDDN